MATQDPPIHQAIWANDLSAVKAQLDAGVSPNLKNKPGRTPLMVASGLGHVEIVHLLLDRGADVFVLDNTIGISALHLAAQGGWVSVGEALLKAGAPVNLQCHTNGMTPLWTAVWHRRVEMVKLLLGQDSISPYITAKIGFSPKELITFMVNMETIGQTSPVRAAQIPEMLTAFDDYDQRLASTKEKQPIYAAIGNFDGKLTPEKQIATVKELIAAGVAIDLPSPIEHTAFDGQTPLLFAATMGQPEVVKMLLEAGADLHKIDAFMLATPIHKSCYMQHPEVVDILAKHKDFLQVVNAQGAYNGYTALHDSIWQGSLKAAGILIEAGADLNLRAHDGLTPLGFALREGYKDLADLLRSRGAHE